ncbi:MAG TPA: hypothetical protein VGI00_15045 [Streptosporangiaceae bacterium]|jgi:hypothetical protein
MTDDQPISYLAAPVGIPVVTTTGAEIGTLEHVLQIPEEDLFDGLVVATKDGLRFVDADQVQLITTAYIRSTLDDDAASHLPAPDGPPVYRVDAIEDTGQSLGDRLGRLFRRAHWIRDSDA